MYKESSWTQKTNIELLGRLIPFTKLYSYQIIEVSSNSLPSEKKKQTKKNLHNCYLPLMKNEDKLILIPRINSPLLSDYIYLN